MGRGVRPGEVGEGSPFLFHQQNVFLLLRHALEGMTTLGLKKFEAKIGQGNEPSICMFKKLHFEQVTINNIFQEVTLRLLLSEPERQWLLEQTGHMEEKQYRDGSWWSHQANSC